MALKTIGATSLTCKPLAIGFLALGLGFCAAVASAQHQPETFFKNRVGLTDSDIQKMDQGQVVTKVLESDDPKYGILVFGRVYINTGFYLIEMNDSRLPDFGGIKLGIVKKVETGKGVESTQDILNLYHKRLGGK